MKKWMTYFKIQFVLSIRSVDGVFFGILMPLGIVGLIGLTSGNELTSGGYSLIQGSFGALITVGVCATAFMGLPLTIADYREKKILKQFFITPAKPSLLLWVNVIICALISTISAICVYLFLHFGWGFTIQGNVYLVIFSYLLTMTAMYGLGMLMASLCKTTKVANLVCTLVYFPMLLLSGASIPFEIFPTWIQTGAKILPLTIGIDLLKTTSMNLDATNVTMQVIYLAIIAIISIVGSMKLFRWE